MDTITKTFITIEAVVAAPLDKIWRFWSEPQHIIQWNNASDDWHTPKAENDLQVGGKFNFTMAAKDGSVSFDFEGVYSNVQFTKLIEYTISDGRSVKISFEPTGDAVKITETFEAENTNSIELQRGGWQAIMDNFKKYAEAN